MVPCTAICLSLMIASMVAFVWFTDIGDDAVRSTQRVSVQRVVADSRWQHWQDGVQTSIVHAPFGAIGTYGYAQLAQQASDSKTSLREAHNQYLETIAEAGVVSAILLMAFCWIAFRTCRMLMRSNRSREAKGWGLAGCLLFMALLIQSFVDFVIVIPANMIVFAAIIGVIVAVYQENMANWHRPDEASMDHRSPPNCHQSGTDSRPDEWGMRQDSRMHW